MPVRTDDISDQEHGEAPEEHRHWVSEAHIESFIHLLLSLFLWSDGYRTRRLQKRALTCKLTAKGGSTEEPLNPSRGPRREIGTLLPARSDAGGEVHVSLRHRLCCSDWIVVEDDLRRPVPIPGADAHLKLARTGRREVVTGAMAVDQAFEFCEEFQQVFVGIHGLSPRRQDAELAGPMFPDFELGVLRVVDESDDSLLTRCDVGYVAAKHGAEAHRIPNDFRVDRPAVPPVVAGGRRGAVGEIDGIEAPSPVGPLRSKRPFAGTFLPLADYLSRPLQPGRAPAQDRSLRASGVVRIERIPGRVSVVTSLMVCVVGHLFT